MPVPSDPCIDCGHPIDRYRKSGLPARCAECGIARQDAHNRGMVAGTNPMIHKVIEAGRAAGEQVRNRKGPAFERWLRGIRYGVDQAEAEGQ
jgi:hypothetical protein